MLVRRAAVRLDGRGFSVFLSSMATSNRQRALLLAKWAESNIRHDSVRRSNTSASTYFTGIGGTNLCLRISDHLKLLYHNNMLHVIFNLDGSVCAIYNTDLFILDGTAATKAFLRHLGLFAQLKLGKQQDTEREKFQTRLTQMCKIANTPAFKAIQGLSKQERKRVNEYISSIVKERKTGKC